MCYCDQKTNFDTWGLLKKKFEKKIIFLYDEVRRLIFLSRSIQLEMLFLAYIILKLEAHN